MSNRASLPSRLELSHYQELTLAKREEKYSEYLLDRFLARPFACRICIILGSYTLRYQPTTRNEPRASISMVGLRNNLSQFCDWKSSGPLEYTLIGDARLTG